MRRDIGAELSAYLTDPETKREMQKGREIAERVLGKQHLGSASPEAQARRHRTAERPVTDRAKVEATRRDLHTPGAAYAVGSERYAADGSCWRRTA
jgi:hypothetical protein